MAAPKEVNIKSWWDEPTGTGTYVVSDPATKKCAIIDSVYGFELQSLQLSSAPSDQVLEYLKAEGLECTWILETHVHADHLTGSSYLKRKLNGTPKTAIGENVKLVQQTFKAFFNLDNLDTSGADFDHLFKDGEEFAIGNLQCKAISTPGHTPACMIFIIEGNIFAGDTIFAPDAGSSRCDFPGGSAETLYESIQKIYSLPDNYKIWLCHDYKPGGRDLLLQTTISEQKENNKHCTAKTTKEEFVEFRTTRDATLKFPKLIMPALQINLRAGKIEALKDEADKYFIKLPLFVDENYHKE